jgi:hypothetical protein
MRPGLTTLILTMLLGWMWLAAEPAHAQAWTKIDCAGAHVLVPAGIQADCFQGPENSGGSASCRYFEYSLTYPANPVLPRFYVRLRESQSPKCGLVFPTAPASVMQHAAKFVEDEGTNWSAVQALDADTNVMFFDAKNQKREGKCFTFTRLGPIMGTGGARAYTMFGYFCKPPGQALDASTAAAMIKALQVKS